MKLAYNFSIILLMAAIPCAYAGEVLPQRADFTKTIKKEYEVGSNATVHINNKYGKVDVKTWDKNRVKIDVRIVVKAATEADAQKVFERINVQFSNTGNYVKAETMIEPQSRKWWDTGGGNKNDYSINYEVFAPASISLELYNKYGDVYAAAIKGKATIDVKYGNFKLDGLSETSNITLAYGNGKLTKAGKLVTDVSYARLNVTEANEMDVNSKYSTITIDKLEALRSLSKYDTYKLGDIELFRNTGKYDNIEVQQTGAMTVSSKYTNVHVAKAAKTLEMNMEYGGVTILQLNKGFSDVNLSGKYTDFKLVVEDGATYRVDALSDYAGIKYPSAMTVTLERKEKSSYEVKGHVGGQQPAAVIKARLSYGGLKVQ